MKLIVDVIIFKKNYLNFSKFYSFVFNMNCYMVWLKSCVIKKFVNIKVIF